MLLVETNAEFQMPRSRSADSDLGAADDELEVLIRGWSGVKEATNGRFLVFGLIYTYTGSRI
jgi:hypothetical protein